MSQDRLEKWKNIIKDYRKNSDFREFLMEIGSWTTMVFNKNSGMISRYPETNRVKICSLEEFEENRDTLTKYGHEYDFKKTFEQNFSNLFKNTTLPRFFHVGENENCDYTDVAAFGKNAYLSFIVSIGSENIFYSFMTRENCKNVFNSLYVIKDCENIYQSSCILDGSYKIFYSKYIKNSNNIWFCTNLIGCNECIFCDDLQNCSYYIKNKKYEKEEYFQKKEEILKKKEKFISWYSEKKPQGKNYNSKESSGNFVTNCTNVEKSYATFNTHNARHMMFGWSQELSENCYDTLFTGSGLLDCYGMSGWGGNPDNIYLCYNSGDASNIFYSYGVEKCSFCFGCIGLKNKSYCILNKQYSKEEWYVMVEKIFENMNQEKVLGKYLPAKTNPLYFNDTFAALFGKFSKEEVQKAGYLWREEKIKTDIPKENKVISVDELEKYEQYNSDGKWNINPQILKLVIKDGKGNYYRIMQSEYDFLLKYELPIPKNHWLQRIKINF